MPSSTWTSRSQDEWHAKHSDPANHMVEEHALDAASPHPQHRPHSELRGPCTPLGSRGERPSCSLFVSVVCTTRGAQSLCVQEGTPEALRPGRALRHLTSGAHRDTSEVAHQCANHFDFDVPVVSVYFTSLWRLGASFAHHKQKQSPTRTTAHHTNNSNGSRRSHGSGVLVPGLG